MPIGSYAKGCAAGWCELPETGPTWQAMRLSRNRNFGQPEMIQFLIDLSDTAAAHRLWQGAVHRRHQPAARRADDQRPRQPPDRPGCRHLDAAAAKPVAERGAARGDQQHPGAVGGSAVGHRELDEAISSWFTRSPSLVRSPAIMTKSSGLDFRSSITLVRISLLSASSLRSWARYA